MLICDSNKIYNFIMYCIMYIYLNYDRGPCILIMYVEQYFHVHITS